MPLTSIGQCHYTYTKYRVPIVVMVIKSLQTEHSIQVLKMFSTSRIVFPELSNGNKYPISNIQKRIKHAYLAERKSTRSDLSIVVDTVIQLIFSSIIYLFRLNYTNCCYGNGFISSYKTS